MLIALRAMGAITIPFEPDAVTGKNKWAVELLETKNDGSAFEKWLVHLTACKLRGILLPDRLVVQDGTGSFAAHESTFSQFFAFLESILEEVVLGPINQQLLWPVQKLNYGQETDLVSLSATPLDPLTKKVFLEALKLVAEMPREIGDAGKQVNNASLVDCLTLLQQMDIPTRDKEDWPETDPLAGEKLKAQTSNRDDATKSDTEKNGAKKPTGDRSLGLDDAPAPVVPVQNTTNVNLSITDKRTEAAAEAPTIVQEHKHEHHTHITNEAAKVDIKPTFNSVHKSEHKHEHKHEHNAEFNLEAQMHLPEEKKKTLHVDRDVDGNIRKITKE